MIEKEYNSDDRHGINLICDVSSCEEYHDTFLAQIHVHENVHLLTCQEVDPGIKTLKSQTLVRIAGVLGVLIIDDSDQIRILICQEIECPINKTIIEPLVPLITYVREWNACSLIEKQKYERQLIKFVPLSPFLLNLSQEPFSGVIYPTLCAQDILTAPKCFDNELYFKFWLELRKNFNLGQLNAIKYSLESSPPIKLIQGPPGTGKTTTIMGVIFSLLALPFGKILVCAASNAAVNVLIKSYLENSLCRSINGTFICRLGIIDDDDELKKFCIHEMVKKNQGYINLIKDLDRLKNHLDKLRAARRFDDMPPIHQNITDTEKFLKNLKVKLYEDVIKKCSIVFSTLSSSGSLEFRNLVYSKSILFPNVIVDEACQATESLTCVPIVYGCDRLVLVGDPKQLPPSGVLVGDPKQLPPSGIGDNQCTTLFGRLIIKDNHKIVMLRVQYRMDPAICEFPSETFYDSLLKNSRFPGETNRLSELLFECRLNPLLFYNYTDRKRGRDQEEETNIKEVNFIFHVLLVSIQTKSVEKNLPISIGIIAPYRAQVNQLNVALKQFCLETRLLTININTVDSFQGQEVDIVIYSCVKSFSNKFTGDPRRLNVAITRARFSFICIGCAQSLGTGSEVWRKFINFCHEKGYIKDININI